MKETIVKLVCGNDKENLERENTALKKEIEYLKKDIENRKEENRQLSIWFLAFVDLFDNFATETNDKKFDDITLDRIRKVGVYYRMFTICKNRNYEIINDVKFSELYQYVSFTFRNVLITGVFTDFDYEKFKELALSYEPLKEFSKGLF